MVLRFSAYVAALGCLRLTTKADTQADTELETSPRPLRRWRSARCRAATLTTSTSASQAEATIRGEPCHAACCALRLGRPGSQLARSLPQAVAGGSEHRVDSVRVEPSPSAPPRTRRRARRRTGRRIPPPGAYLCARLLEGSPGPRGRRRSSASPPHPSRRAPRPGRPHWDRERRSNPWTRAAFASRRPWLRRFPGSDRNPRPSSLPGSSNSSSVGSVVALLRDVTPVVLHAWIIRRANRTRRGAWTHRAFQLPERSPAKNSHRPSSPGGGRLAQPRTRRAAPELRPNEWPSQPTSLSAT